LGQKLFPKIGEIHRFTAQSLGFSPNLEKMMCI